MIYVDELENYIKHFPIIYAWKVNANGSLDYSNKLIYYNVKPLLEEARNSDNIFYEVHTDLNTLQYLDKGKIKTAFGIAIDVDTKDRENKVTEENLQKGKDTIVKIAKAFITKFEIQGLLKFSGGGYHFLMFFSTDLITDDFDKKDIKKVITNVIKQMEKDGTIDKDSVKEIEIKDDKIRAMYSYNSKYGNYSIPTDAEKTSKEDLENSRKYLKQEDVDYSALVIKALKNENLSGILRDIETQKEKSKKQLNLILTVEKGIKELGINIKQIKSIEEFSKTPDYNKIADYVKQNTNEKSLSTIRNVIGSYISMEKSMSFYDKIYEYGAKDGRKRLLFLVIIPYLNIKTNGNKAEMEKLATEWLKKSGVSDNGIFFYMSEMKSSINNMVAGIRPTSIDSLLMRFGCSRDEFLREYINSG